MSSVKIIADLLPYFLPNFFPNNFKSYGDTFIKNAENKSRLGMRVVS